jgi:hypothetical protein
MKTCVADSGSWIEDKLDQGERRGFRGWMVLNPIQIEHTASRPQHTQSQLFEKVLIFYLFFMFNRSVNTIRNGLLSHA